jgi:hypothetical protein
MGIKGYGIFIRLLMEGHNPEQMGLKGTAGDVARWRSRVKLARNFRGVQIDEYSERSLLGYSAFFQVFLTHSALERYLEIVGLTLGNLENALLPYNPHEQMKQFFARDRSGKLFDFLHPRLNSNWLSSKLTACREGTCSNVGCLSASVRHIFAHGHLGATSHDINPKQVAHGCKGISDFLLAFMECDFTYRIGKYDLGIARERISVSSGGQLQHVSGQGTAGGPVDRPARRRCASTSRSGPGHTVPPAKARRLE